MKAVIFIDEKILKDYQSSLFPLFSPKIADRFIVTASFKDYQPDLFPVFSDLSDYVAKVMTDKKIEQYGLVIDTRKIRLDEVGRRLLRRAKFIFLLGPGRGDQVQHPGLIRASCLYQPGIDGGKSSPGLVLAELATLSQAYDEVLERQYFPSSVQVLCPPESANLDQWPGLRRWRQKFAELKIALIYHWPSKAVYDYLLDQRPDFLGRPSTPLDLDLGRVERSDSPDRPLTLDEFCDRLAELAVKAPRVEICPEPAKLVNIVCYQPSYLFKDLVDRLVARGCAHSDFPRPEAGAYIWLRPQELWHLDFALKGLSNDEIPGDYAKAAPRAAKGLDMNQIRGRSVAIHHGTCHEPIYQFCPYKLAHSLRSVARVIGVCEFEECYGPAVAAANRSNFDFRPIGYDHRLFTQDLVRRETRNPESRLRLGFVGRAYGTLNRELLNNSRLAEPRGYRKGGDALRALAARLKLAGLDFELNIVGNNWDELVEQLKADGQAVNYQVRDRDVTYQDYPELYRRMDALLITSRCEGGPVSALEALALGVKVVSSRVGLIGYLERQLQGTESVFTYEYDRKWMLFDLDQAVQHLGHLYKSPISYRDRLRTRALIESLTMDSWLKHIYDQAARLCR
jgi:Glycosyltransferase